MMLMAFQWSAIRSLPERTPFFYFLLLDPGMTDLSRKSFSESPDIKLFCDRQIMLKSIGRKGVALVDVACLKSFPKPSNPLSGAAMGE